MSSGCGDVLTLEDLKTAKKHQIFEAEVITGRTGGVAGGAEIDSATNPVTGDSQKTLPAVLRDAGFSPVSWDFSTGGMLSINDRDKVVFDDTTKTWYSWSGNLPHTVAAGTDPKADARWVPQTDPNLRAELSDVNGATTHPEFQMARWRDEGDIRGWGCKCDGVSDDTLKMQQAFDESKRIKLVGNPLVSGAILIRENQNIVSDGAIISTTSDTLSILYANNVDGWSITGKLTIERKGYTTAPTVRVETACGLAVQDCLNYHVDGVVSRGFAGSGFYFTASTPESRGFVASSLVTNCVAHHNYSGFTTRPGFAAEYVSFTGCISRYNYHYGVENLSGNIQWTGGQVTHNTLIGFSVQSGFNDAHGNVSGTAINHNSAKAIEVVGTNNGFTFSGCSVFDNAANDGYTGGIYFDNCSGVVFSGCQLMADIIEVSTSGRNLISNCMFVNAPARPYAHTIASGGRNVLLRGCVRAGADNLGLRNAFGGSGIEFTLSNDQTLSGTSGAVIFNSASYAFGQIQYDASAGLVNIFHAGEYFIDLNLSATSAAANVYADVYRGSTLVASVPAALKPGGGFSVSGRIPFSAGRGESIKVEIRASTAGVTVIGGSFIRVALID